MDFGRPLIETESITIRSKIRYLPLTEESDNAGVSSGVSGTDDENKNKALEEILIKVSNKAAKDLLCGDIDEPVPKESINSNLYKEYTSPAQQTIQPGDLVVIMESFDKLNFVYAEAGQVFANRNGHFHHDDFLGRPFGCKIRSRCRSGFGFCYLLRPTPELWCRSLVHRTQVVHELDQAQIVFELQLRPGCCVVESGTGSGAMSHAILRTIAPIGSLHTYEFNVNRAEEARKEFAKNGVSHLVTVHHKDVCGKTKDCSGGFDLPSATVDAVFLDLPEPWLAVPFAAVVLKPDARIASYSPCVEQTQRTIQALTTAGFHSIKTMEYRLREHYVDEVEYEPPPTQKRQKREPHDYSYLQQTPEEDQESTSERKEPANLEGKTNDQAGPSSAEDEGTSGNVSKSSGSNVKKVLVARPFVNMRGHTAFLTFATASCSPRVTP